MYSGQTGSLTLIWESAGSTQSTIESNCVPLALRAPTGLIPNHRLCRALCLWTAIPPYFPRRRNPQPHGFMRRLSGERSIVTPVAKSEAVLSPSSPRTTFASLKLAPPILDALVADGYEFPTPIQAQAIPPALEERDVLGIAQTGTGKTAAFALPIINHLLAAVPRGGKLPAGRRPKALILAPTRELAAQIGESFSSYGRHTPLRHSVIFGGVGQGPQVRTIQQGVDVLVATPGRLIDLLDQRLVSLTEIDFLVLDEADRMLDMGFIEPIRRITKVLPRDRQTMLFSATMPKEIRALANTLLNDPVTVTVTPVSSAVDRITQKLYFVLKAQKTQLLIHLIHEHEIDRTLVFTKTKHGADRLTRKLKAAGIHADAIHGDKAQNQRIRALEAFRSGRTPVLVATDVAARGLDVDDITHVFNYDLPMEPEAYVHRIGRTARAGKSGDAISFCDVEEKGLLRDIEKLTKFDIPRERVPDSVPKTDDAAARASGIMPMAAERSHRAPQPSIETRTPPSHGMQPPRRSASPAHAQRSSGPRIDRRMDEGASREPAPEVRSHASHGKPAARPAASHQSRNEKPSSSHGGRPAHGATPQHGARPSHGSTQSAHPTKSHAPKPHAPKPHAPTPHAVKSAAPKANPAKHAGPVPHASDSGASRHHFSRQAGHWVRPCRCQCYRCRAKRLENGSRAQWQ